MRWVQEAACAIKGQYPCGRSGVTTPQQKRFVLRTAAVLKLQFRLRTAFGQITQVFVNVLLLRHLRKLEV